MTSKVTPDKETITIRVSSKLRFEIDRLAVEKGRSRNQMAAELLDTAIADHKDMTPIRKAIEASKGFFDELKIEKLAENLKTLDLTFHHKAYLAYKLSLEQRTELFSRLGYKEEKEESYALDKILKDSKEDKKINLHLLANGLNFKISDFGQEYLTWFIADKGIEKLQELKPGMLPDVDVSVDLTEESDYNENIPELEEVKS